MPWTSKTVEGAAPTPIKNPARDILRLASNVGESEIAVKSRLSAVMSALSMFEIEFPDPFASKATPVMAPVADISQSLVSINPVSPLSPKMNLPAVWKLPAIDALPLNLPFLLL